ncbi:hypothetical protein [Anaerosalibacter bizertensis]|uniref:hypothetical protein n=1 Tax=Anaerosalibacter bizertensis TaxID=932217 RepID=UPI001E4EFFC2|nr:hypothetical protein [Anaerosalibacter bizertensis]
MEYDSLTKTWKGELLGATHDGNKITIEQEYRKIEVDGVFVDAVGQKVLQTSKAMLEVNVKEITAENLRLAINGTVREAGEDEAPEGYQVIEGKGKLENTDYIKNLGLVGTLTGSEQPIIIILDNALCTSGLEGETKDDDELVITMEFEAHADAENVSNRKLPCRIYFPPVATEPETPVEG